MTTAVRWDREKFIQLCDAHKTAKAAKQDRFKLTLKPEGEIEFEMGYARYLIEYLEHQFKSDGPIRQPDNEGEDSYTPGSGSWEGDDRFTRR
jgi:hypothetical protein